MLLRLSLLFEMLSVVVCTHRLYNRKVQFDISAIAVVLLSTFIFEMVNFHGANKILTILAYVLVVIYCKYKFEDTIFGAVLSLGLTMILLAVVQFLATFLISLFIGLEETALAIVANLLVIGCFFCVLPKCRVHALKRMIKKYKGILLLVIFFGVNLVLYLQLQQRTHAQIYQALFMLIISAVILLLVMASILGLTKNEKQKIEDELQVTQSMQEKQRELIQTIRLRQHEFKNHLAAILATHYTYQSYENLVDAQREYYGELVQENKYNDLLSLNNAILVGFLYEKFQEIEMDEIGIEYKIKGTFPLNIIPAHYLIEMIGILLDNAAQAVKEQAGLHIVHFVFCEQIDRYQFMIRNPFPYTRFDETEAWFQVGKSTKGEGRGLGLYRVKSLCKEEQCDIICKNVDIENENWIEFSIEIQKANKL